MTLDELKSLKNEKAKWCLSTESALKKMEREYGIEIGRRV